MRLFTVIATFCALISANEVTEQPVVQILGPTHPNHTSESCTGECGFVMVEAIADQIGYEMTVDLLKLNYHDFIRTFSNVSFFEHFCKVYNEFRNCTSQCETGFLHKVLTKSADVVDHFCVYNFEEIKRLFPCIQETPPAKNCTAQCAPLHNAVARMVQHYGQPGADHNTTHAEEEIGESCEYVICSLNCDVPDIANRCGHETANLVVDLTRKSFDTMENTSLETGIVKKWPSHCENVQTYELLAPPNQSTAHSMDASEMSETSAFVAGASVSSILAPLFVAIIIAW